MHGKAAVANSSNKVPSVKCNELVENKEKKTLDTELQCSAINWNYHFIFNNLIIIGSNWVTILGWIIVLQNFVMEASHAFINAPAEQKYVAF